MDGVFSMHKNTVYLSSKHMIEAAKRFQYFINEFVEEGGPGGGYYTFFGYGDVPSGRVSIFTILV